MTQNTHSTLALTEEQNWRTKSILILIILACKYIVIQYIYKKYFTYLANIMTGDLWHNFHNTEGTVKNGTQDISKAKDDLYHTLFKHCAKSIEHIDAQKLHDFISSLPLQQVEFFLRQVDTKKLSILIENTDVNKLSDFIYRIPNKDELSNFINGFNNVEKLSDFINYFNTDYWLPRSAWTGDLFWNLFLLVDKKKLSQIIAWTDPRILLTLLYNMWWKELTQLINTIDTKEFSNIFTLDILGDQHKLHALLDDFFSNSTPK
jgi:hypothetical protein